MNSPACPPKSRVSFKIITCSHTFFLCRHPKVIEFLTDQPLAAPSSNKIAVPAPADASCIHAGFLVMLEEKSQWMQRFCRLETDGTFAVYKAAFNSRRKLAEIAALPLHLATKIQRRTPAELQTAQDGSPEKAATVQISVDLASLPATAARADAVDPGPHNPAFPQLEKHDGYLRPPCATKGSSSPPESPLPPSPTGPLPPTRQQSLPHDSTSAQAKLMRRSSRKNSLLKVEPPLWPDDVTPEQCLIIEFPSTNMRLYAATAAEVRFSPFTTFAGHARNLSIVLLHIRKRHLDACWTLIAYCFSPYTADGQVVRNSDGVSRRTQPPGRQEDDLGSNQRWHGPDGSRRF